MLPEVIETSKCYVDAAIIGMILSGTCPSKSISNEPYKESNGYLNWIIE